MKLDFNNITIDRSGTFKSEQFGIGDTRVIMEILRGKMYSNPIQTICQEIMCNARDAHREVGKSHQPIEVKLPNRLDPTFWIRDFGPGITPERMADVFIKYGNSTKRSDNVQTGGFGLGAKSPFSYSDTFIVVSNTPTEGIMYSRQYIAHIDETGLGAMTLVKEEPTQEAQGTTIAISPKPGDFASFARFVRRAGAHWYVKPIIKGDPHFKWPKFTVTKQGANWYIVDKSSSNNEFSNKPLILIDGIPYNLNLNHLYSSNIPMHLSTLPLRLTFDVGVLPITANREELDYQKSTIDIVKQRIDTALHQLAEQLTKGLEKQPNLLAAVQFYKECRRQTYGAFVTNARWKDIYVKDMLRVEIPSNTNIRLASFSRDESIVSLCRKGRNEYYGRSYNSISFETDNILILEDDTGQKHPSRGRLASIFEKHPKVSVVYLVNFLRKLVKQEVEPGKYNIDYELDPDGAKKRKEFAIKHFHYNLWNVGKFSDYPKKKLPRNGSTKKSVKVKKLVWWPPSTTPNWEPVESISELPDEPKYHVLVSGPSVYLTKEPPIKAEIERDGNKFTKTIKNETKIKIRDLQRYLIAHYGYTNRQLTVYGVIPSHEKNLGSDWKRFGDYAKEWTKKEATTVDTAAGGHDTASRRISRDVWKIISSDTFLKRLVNPDGILRKYILASLRDEQLATQQNYMNEMLCALELPPLKIPYSSKSYRDMYQKILKTYPLAAPSLSGYGNANFNSTVDDLVAYVNMKDNQ